MGDILRWFREDFRFRSEDRVTEDKRRQKSEGRGQRTEGTSYRRTRMQHGVLRDLPFVPLTTQGWRSEDSGRTTEIRDQKPEEHRPEGESKNIPRFVGRLKTLPNESRFREGIRLVRPFIDLRRHAADTPLAVAPATA